MSKKEPKEFVENNYGIHLVSALTDTTVCGDALEGDPANGLDESRKTKNRKITCRKCALEIENCRSVQIGVLVEEKYDE